MTADDAADLAGARAIAWVGALLIALSPIALHLPDAPSGHSRQRRRLAL